MSNMLRIFYKYLLVFGVDPRRMFQSSKGFVPYYRNYLILKKQASQSRKKFPFGEVYPCLDDRFKESGATKGHYFYQDWLVASRIYENKPAMHFDVGSRIDGFVSHVATFRPITVIDIRPLETSIENITFIQADLMSGLESNLIASCDSLSCLHTLEHFGLGRYGDPVNYDGYLVGFENLSLLLKPYGKFYLSVPIGHQRIEYNAHRVFSISYLLELLRGRFVIDKFSYVNDQDELIVNAELTDEHIMTNFGCKYGCGIFEMTKA